MIRTLAAALATTTCLVALATPAAAQTREYNVPAGSLRTALDSFARQSGRQVIYQSDVRTARSPGVSGARTAEDALAAILVGSGFVVRTDRSGAFAIVKAGNGNAAAASPTSLTGYDATSAATTANPEIVVTGSRIRGAALASPTVTISRSMMDEEGQRNLTDVLSNIPQNFMGGQNPGVGQGVGGSNNTSSATSFNLRGAGPDATLTLLNGSRIAYNAQYQAIDVSTVPFNAVERIEIVPDGSSALYGSDAVAGVANIILRRRYSGLTTDARFSAATDGGAETQQYGILAGTRWGSGGVMGAYEFERSTAIYGRQRSYAEKLAPGLTLFPELKHHNAVASLNQELSPNISFDVDALYNKRWSNRYTPVDTRADYLLNGLHIASISEAFAIAPRLRLSLPHRWNLNIAGSYAQDHSRFNQEQFRERALLAGTYICYCNTAHSAEANADGPVFSLPGGEAKIAIGGGYRSNRFRETRQKIDVSQRITYGFAELNLPLISPGLGVSFVHRLTVSAAMRFEDATNSSGIVTPKLGLIYSPTSDLDLKGTWGRSFRMPTLFQQYQPTVIALFPAASRGGTNLPATATVLQTQGGNRALEPERATTWSASIGFHPSWIEGARLELTYFNIDYKNRIVAPITRLGRALSDATYSEFVNSAPTAQDIAAIVGLGNIVNVTPLPFNSASVVGIIRNQNVNAASQSLQGIDVAASYEFPISNGGTLTLSTTASYLDSSRRLSAQQPSQELAGTVFNSPHFRARGGLAWREGSFSLTAFVTHLGGVQDTRFTPTVDIDGMTTIDLTARYSITNGPRIFRGTTVSISALNVLNAKPSPIAQQSIISESPYDSTNYSPLGRVISLSLSKTW